PLLRRRGLTLMGAYSVPMRSDEAVLIWAAADFAALCRVYDQRASDDQMQRWSRDVEPLRRSFETMWLVPSADCFFHPMGPDGLREQK
ncbi:MAG TPA: hypothetical protein VMT89_02285, partial [Candidatus Acidoferrales bacterium]|nr:hypothetical protein [Candidatus Acidoferrales bacterium]